jgi:hypothetical protein
MLAHLLYQSIVRLRSKRVKRDSMKALQTRLFLE